MALVMISRKT